MAVPPPGTKPHTLRSARATHRASWAACSLLPRAACRVQRAAARCRVLPRAAACYRVLPRAIACCRVLPRAAARTLPGSLLTRRSPLPFPNLAAADNGLLDSWRGAASFCR